MTYNTLICGGFETVVRINREKLPVCRRNGESVRTTAPAVHEAYRAHFGPVDFGRFDRAFFRSFVLVSEFRNAESKEVRNQERMRVLLRLLGHQADRVPAEVLESLTRAQADQLAESFEVRQEAIEVLEWAARNFRLALISNFDHPPALHAALDRFGIRACFAAVTVSGDVGWRMPHRIIFERALAALGRGPDNALFIGDQLSPDVCGAIHSGLDAVWISPAREEWRRAGLPAPTQTIGSFGEVIPLLETSLTDGGVSLAHGGDASAATR